MNKDAGGQEVQEREREREQRRKTVAPTWPWMSSNSWEDGNDEIRRAKEHVLKHFTSQPPPIQVGGSHWRRDQ